MKRGIATLLTVTVVLAAAGAGVLAWLAVRPDGTLYPQISAYTRGQLARVGPFAYCDPRFESCVRPENVGELTVDSANVVQLSVPEAIGYAPWRLLVIREGGFTEAIYRPKARLAVTIPTVEPQQGKLEKIVVQLPTVVQDETGELHETYHAEWTVETHWPEQ